ncbi:MAG TPA: polyphosphate kinase 1 [Spirochaetia bacterium]|nr:polyphosphate kinase 1 [Spirochaetia bacterium]
MSTTDTVQPRYVNRELSWLEFNARVLHQALRTDVPLLERLKFLCIVTSNFDEFFMVRVASVKRQIKNGDFAQCPSGIAPSTLLDQIITRTRELVEQKYRCLIDDVLPGLAAAGLVLRRPDEYASAQASFITKLFQEEIFPVLTPVRATEGQEVPYVTNLRLHAAFIVEPQRDANLISEDGEQATGKFLAIVQIPSSLDRIIFLPDEAGRVSFTLLEDVIVQHAAALFPGYRVVSHCIFRVTRDADMGVDEERDEDFVEAMEQVLAYREFSEPVRLSVSRGAGELRKILARVIGIDESEVFDKGEPLDTGALMGLTSLPGLDDLKYPRWPHYESPDVDPDESIWDSIRKRDILFHHPYESFDPVIRLLQEAASDSSVLAIKMTLYRTSGDSPVVRALEKAAEAGKQVTVLVEIKARFDEERNISWAERLERAGVIVIFGIARLKVHGKALLIVRREQHGVRRYVHLGTGNYNDKTARLYTDFGLLTASPDIAYEAGLFFNAITGYSAIPALNKLVMAPVGLKTRLLQLIDRETRRSSSDMPGRIDAKLNSLADPDVIEALYRASQAGVRVRLTIRGICMLVPGVNGLSENITVVSIVDRYLEHARVIYVHNGGAPELYASSADWMPRNLERRVELMFPIEDADARARVVAMLQLSFADTTNAHRMQPDGSYLPPSDTRTSKAIRSQEALQTIARERTRSTDVTNQKVFEVRRKAPRG